MAKRKSSESRTDTLTGEAALARRYRDGAREQPPAALDARILAAARAVAPRRRFVSSWTAPLSAAAVLVLSVGLALFMSERGVFETPGTPLPELAKEIGALGAPAAAPATSLATAPAKQAASPVDEMKSLADRAEPAPAVGAATSAAMPALLEKRKAEKLDEQVLGRADTRAQSPAKIGTLVAGADVVSVQVSGAPGAYQFTVGIASQDAGCQRYADWWEVLSEDGRLLYRRVLAHSHVEEQPFARSGGPVAVAPDTVVWVRAHMNIGGYGGAAFKGSVRAGFQKAELSPGFAGELATQPPLPDGCAF